MSSSQLLLNPEEDISQEDAEFWSSLMSKVNLGEQQQQPPTDQIEVAPRPAFCVKTKDKEGTKVFLNICTHESIPVPRKITVEELVELLESDNDEMTATDYRIPMSIGEAPHAEVDKKGSGCSVYDIVINPNYVKTLKEEAVFFNFFLQVVFQGLATKFEIELDWDWTMLKNRSHVGRIRPHMIRTYKKPVIQEVKSSGAAARKKTTRPTQPAPKPDYLVLQEPPEGKPNYLIVEVWLPGVQSSAKLTLDVGEDRLILHAHPALYFLEVELPFDVIPLECGAQFDVDSHLLTIALMTTEETSQ